MRTTGLWPVVFLVASAGCGGDDDDDAESALCTEVQAKHDECGTGIDMLASCDSSSIPSEMECGMRECTLAIDCAEFREYMERQFMTTEHVACYRECGVMLSDTFDCADGSGQIPIQSQCDGTEGCPDGSDEVGCT